MPTPNRRNFVVKKVSAFVACCVKYWVSFFFGEYTKHKIILLLLLSDIFLGIYFVLCVNANRPDPNSEPTCT